MNNEYNQYKTITNKDRFQKYLEKLNDPDSEERKKFNKDVDDFIKKQGKNKNIVTQDSYLKWFDNFMQNQVKGDRFNDEDFAYFPEEYQATEEDKQKVNLLCDFIYYVLEPFLNLEDDWQRNCFFSINNNYYFIEEIHGQGTSVMVDKLKKEPCKIYVNL